MADCVCTTIAPGKSNPTESTTIESHGIETASNEPEIPLNDPSSGGGRKRSASEGLENARSQKKRDLLILRTSNEGVNDIPTGRHQRCTQSSAALELLNKMASLSTDSVMNQKNDLILVEELLDKMLSGSRDSIIVSTQVLEKQEGRPILIEKLPDKIASRNSVFSIPTLAQILGILKNYWILVHATQQLEKMLPRSGHTSIVASKILSYLSREDLVLLSCSTVMDCRVFPTPLNWGSSENWLEEELEVFCRKISYLAPGRWEERDVLEKWNKLYSSLTRHIRKRERYVVEGGGTDDSGCYSEILRKVRRQHKHRMREAQEMAIKDRAGSVIQWDLVGMKVNVVWQ